MKLSLHPINRKTHEIGDACNKYLQHRHMLGKTKEGTSDGKSYSFKIWFAVPGSAVDMLPFFHFLFVASGSAVPLDRGPGQGVVCAAALACRRQLPPIRRHQRAGDVA